MATKMKNEGEVLEAPVKYSNKWEEALAKGWTMQVTRVGQKAIRAPQTFNSRVYDENEELIRDFSGDGNSLSLNGSNFYCNLATADKSDIEIAKCYAVLSGLIKGYRPKKEMGGGVQRQMPTWGLLVPGADQMYEVSFMQEKVASKNASTITMMKYLTKVISMKDAELKRLSIVALGINSNDEDTAMIQAKITEILQSPNEQTKKSVMRFIDMMDDDKFLIYFYLKTASGDEKEMKGVYRKSDGIYFMDTRLGIDYDQAVEYISSKKDADKLNIIQALKGFTEN